MEEEEEEDERGGGGGGGPDTGASVSIDVAGGVVDDTFLGVSRDLLRTFFFPLLASALNRLFTPDLEAPPF